MNINEAKQILDVAIAKYQPVLLVGSPGIGKTQIIKEIAETNEYDLLITHPAVSDPTDAKGLPAIIDNEAQFLPYGDLRKALEYDGKLLIWLFDDMGQAPPSVQAGYMQLIRRNLNQYTLSKNVVPIAATNRIEDKAGVSGILAPIQSSFSLILQIESEPQAVITYGIKNDWNKDILVTLKLYPELTNKNRDNRNIESIPCPRQWEFTNRIMQLNFQNNDILERAIESSIGCEAANILLGVKALFGKLPTINELMNDPNNVNLPTDSGDKNALCIVLLKYVVLKVNDSDIDKIIKACFAIAKRLDNDFEIMLIDNLLEIYPNCVDTKEYVEFTINNNLNK